MGSGDSANGAQAKKLGAMRTLVILACVVVLVAGLKAAGSLLTPLIVALFFAVLCVPPLNRMKSWGIPEWAAITIVVLGATGMLLLILLIIGSSLASFESKLPSYRVALDAQVNDVFVWLQNRGIDSDPGAITDRFHASSVLDLIQKLVTQLLAALSQVFLVILTMIFMLVEASTIPRKLRLALRNEHDELKDWGLAMESVQKYVAIKAEVSLMTAVLAGLIAWVMGVDFPLLWALIAFLFNFIPNIGSVIAAIGPVLLALVTNGVTNAMVVGGGYLAINLVIGNVVEPRLMGRKLGLSTLVVFLSLILWNWVWGPVGMVLSVPLTVIVKILLEHSDEFSGLAILLGTEAESREKHAAQSD